VKKWALLLFCLAALAIRAPADQERRPTPYEALAGNVKRQFDKCAALERKIASAPADARLPLGQKLFAESGILVAQDKNIFRAWLWRGLSAQLLNKKDECLQAISELAALGGAQSGNLQAAHVVQKAAERGWLPSTDPSHASAVQTRHQTPYEALTGDLKRRFDECAALERKIAATPEDARLPLGKQLLEQSGILVAQDKNIFRGWIWQGLSALMLGKKDECLQAISELAALDGAQSGNLQVAYVVKKAAERGWLPPTDPTQASGAQARHQTPYEALPADVKRQFDKCEALERKLASTPANARLPLGRQLLAESGILVAQDQNLFRGWLWRALSALMLDKKDECLQAISELAALDGAQSKNLQLARVVQKAVERGWLRSPDPTHASSGKTTSLP